MHYQASRVFYHIDARCHRYRLRQEISAEDVNLFGESERVVLIETEGEMIEYVTLSYCWGPIEKPVWNTTTHNLGDRKKHGISVSSLPKTLQDAVTVVCKLGYRYLWIDSLCILQNSLEDWRDESARMGQYYENSVFTISASSAETSLVGFLNTRAPATCTPIVVPVDRGEQSRGHLYVPRRPNTFETNIKLGPLSERGWVLQERLLSRGVLHYGKEQMFWECQSAQRGESVFQDLLRDSILNPSSVAFHEYNLKRPSKPSKMVMNLLHWYGIIEDYTTRKLTKGMDKLPALSGLASEAQKQLGASYLAGLWSDKLHVGLSWIVLHDSSGCRPSIYRAPSWSWASVDGPISYQPLDGYFPTSDGFVESAIDVIEARTEIAASDPFGQVVGGRIVLSGQLKFARKKEMLPNKILTYPASMMGHEKMVGYYIEDEQNEFDCDILCLKLATQPFGIGPSIPPANIILILEPTGSDAYRRVGSGTVWQTDWFNDSLQRIITLI
jgi:heterokaryon incompatibility protein (HET)